MSGLSRPDSKRGKLQRALLDLLAEHEANGELPTNGRFLFYELEQRGIVSKLATGARRADQDMLDALTHLREEQFIPWDWIVDETRSLGGYDRAETVEEAVAAYTKSATINPWASPPPLVLVESRSLGGVLRGLVQGEYRCRLAATNGQVRGFLHTEIAPILEENERRILYLGDYDLSGAQIEAHSRRVLERETGREIGWQRVAITAEQIEERGLTPIVKHDRRYRSGARHEAWETEALGQRTVLALVREELDRLLPEPLEDVQARGAGGAQGDPRPARQPRRGLDEAGAGAWRAERTASYSGQNAPRGRTSRLGDADHRRGGSRDRDQGHHQGGEELRSLSRTTPEMLLRLFAKVLLFLIIVQVVLALSGQGYLP